MEKTERVALRCSPTERHVLDRIAQAEAGGNLSQALRKVVQEAADRRGLIAYTRGDRNDQD